jgi:hypothetical protein
MSSNVTDAATESTGVNADHSCAAHPQVIDADKAIVEVSPPRSEVAICGFASSTRHLIPIDDNRVEIWGLNQLYRHIDRADRWFDIHRNWEEDNVEGTDHPKWLKECGIPIYMVKRDHEIPTSIRFPIERMIASASDYFTSTVAYMLALAISEGFSKIHLYGIDLVVGTEYEVQKSCVEFWLGMAHGKGIDLNIPQSCALLTQTHRYGYEKQPGTGPMPNIEELTLRITALREAKNKHMASAATLDGALQEIEYVKQIAELRSRGATVPIMTDQ